MVAWKKLVNTSMNFRREAKQHLQRRVNFANGGRGNRFNSNRRNWANYCEDSDLSDSNEEFFEFWEREEALSLMMERRNSGEKMGQPQAINEPLSTAMEEVDLLRGTDLLETIPLRGKGRKVGQAIRRIVQQAL